MTKKIGLIVILGVALLSLATYAALWVRSQDQFRSYAVDVNAGGHHFQIPRNYFAYPPEYDQKDIAAVLEVLWPGFNPRKRSNAHRFEPAMKQRLYMIIDTEPALVKLFNPYDRFSAYRNATVNDEVRKKYEQQGLRNMEYFGSQDGDLFVTKDRRFFTSCTDILSDMSNPVCTAQINTLLDVKIFIRFSSNYVDDFPKIVNQIETFLEAHEIIDKAAAR